jgi:hypothetical protein
VGRRPFAFVGGRRGASAEDLSPVTSLAPSVPDPAAGHESADRSPFVRGAPMSESDPTGYRESPDTTDGAVGPSGSQQGGEEADVTLTTDDEAQQDDGIVRPGNEPD